MVAVIVNKIQFEFNDNVAFETVIKEAMKHSELKRLTISRPSNLLYLRNEKFVKYEDLIKQEVKDGDEISMLLLVSGG